MSRSCSQCGNNGHNSRTCADATAAENGIMLFGVRVTAEGSSSSSFRKSVSMNNLSQFDQPVDSNADAGYASDDVVHPSVRSRERKRGVPWTEEEHKLFLLGLQKVGKGDWRGISRNFVKTRTPTQVASHAQKYFLRRFNQNRRRRRSSLFDITTDSFLASSSMEIEEGVGLPPAQPQPQPQTRQQTPTPYLSVTGESSTIRQARPLSTKLIRPIPILPIPPSSKMADLNLNEKPNHVDPPLPLSLNLTTSEEQQQQQQSSAPTASQNSHSSSSAFQTMSSGDSIISVA